METMTRVGLILSTTWMEWIIADKEMECSLPPDNRVVDHESRQ